MTVPSVSSSGLLSPEVMPLFTVTVCQLPPNSGDTAGSVAAPAAAADRCGSCARNSFQAAGLFLKYIPFVWDMGGGTVSNNCARLVPAAKVIATPATPMQLTILRLRKEVFIQCPSCVFFNVQQRRVSLHSRV